MALEAGPLVIAGDLMVWDWIDKMSQITGILAFLPILGTLWLVWGQERRRRRELKAIREAPGDRPAVLIIDIGSGGSIRGQVENFIGQQESLRQVLDSNNISCISRNHDLNRDEVDGIVKELRQSLDTMRNKGVTKVHLFYKGPVALAAMIGAELSNQTPTVLYQHMKNIGYENWGPLHR